MRYAWDFDAEARRFPRALRAPARPAMAILRRVDRSTARSVTRFVANSRAVADRIRRFYGRDAVVVHPPVRTDFFTPGTRNGHGGDFLYVGRLVSYKRPDLAVAAFAGLPYRLLVVGDGHLGAHLRAEAPANVTFLGEVGDVELRRLYREACALVYPSEEDFGLVMAEAQACGTPVIGLARGGALDIVEPGRTGWLIERPDVELLRSAVERSAEEELDRAEISRRAQRFSADRFRGALRTIVEEAVSQRRAA
jgi:glycosyltransferase involved in cell wall biosynthesis